MQARLSLKSQCPSLATDVSFTGYVLVLVHVERQHSLHRLVVAVLVRRSFERLVFDGDDGRLLEAAAVALHREAERPDVLHADVVARIEAERATSLISV